MELRPQDHGEKGRGLQGHLPDRPTSSKRQVPEHLRHGSAPRSGAGFYPFGDGKQPWTRPAAVCSADLRVHGAVAGWTLYALLWAGAGDGTVHCCCGSELQSAGLQASPGGSLIASPPSNPSGHTS